MSAAVTKAGPYYSSGSISFSSLRSNFRAQQPDGSFSSDTLPIKASELLRSTVKSNTEPVVPDSTENSSIGEAMFPSISGTTLTVSGQSYSVDGTSYPVQGRLWVPTSLPTSSVDLVVAYHPTIELGTTTILQSADTMLSILKNTVDISDKIIFCPAYPQDAITVAQNINLLTQSQLSNFRFGDNLPYARAALLWGKNSLNSYLSSLGATKTVRNVYMFGHSQGGSLAHKLNTLETTNGVVVNAPGPIRLDETCSAVESVGGSDITCSKLFSAYGSATTTPLSSNEYYLRSVFNYTTGHKAPITYLQATDDTTGIAPGVDGQVIWMEELTAQMSTNGQTFEYIKVPSGGHDAFARPYNTLLHNAIKRIVGSKGIDLKASQFRNSIKYYFITQSGTDDNVSSPSAPGFNIGSQSWNSNLNKNIRKYMYLNGTMGSSNISQPAVYLLSETHNLRVNVSGGVYGAGGSNGTSGNISGGNGGPAMFVRSTGSEVTITVNNTANIYGGGGGGEKGKTGDTGSSGTCTSTSFYTTGTNCGGCPGCSPGYAVGYNEAGGNNCNCGGKGGCRSKTCSTNCRVDTPYSVPGAPGGEGGNGGVGQGYNQSRTNGSTGTPGTTGGCPSYGGSGQTGETGGNGGDWGVSGGNTSNSGAGGSSGRAISGSNYSVTGTISSATIKGLYQP